MKLKSLELQNFKAIGEEPQKIRFAPITLLFGPNSAGKSTIIQALVFLREVFLHRNLNPDFTELGGDWLDLGGFESLVNGHDRSKKILIALEIEGTQIGVSELWDSRDDDALDSWEGGAVSSFLEDIGYVRLSITIAFSERTGSPYCSRFEVGVNGDFIVRIETDADGQNPSISKINFDHKLLNTPPAYIEESDITFVSVFEEVVNRDKVGFSGNNAFLQTEEERPFIRYRVPELKDLVDGMNLGDSDSSSEPVALPFGTRTLLTRIKEELANRQQRKAFELRLKIEEILQQLSDIPEATDEIRILLDGMSDALPFGMSQLNYYDQIWLTEEDGSLNRQKFIEIFLNSIVIGSFNLFERQLSDLNYIGPLRQLPVRQFTSRKTPAKSRWSSGLAAWEFLHEASKKFVGELNTWIGDGRLNTGYEVRVKRFRELETDNPLITYLDQQADADQQALISSLIDDLPIQTRVMLREINSGLEVMPQDVGVGVSQLLPVVIATMQNNPGVLAVEQPELHIHPAIQVELADLFAAYANSEPEKIYLLETHSEHLLLRLLKRIRDSAEQVNDPAGISGVRLVAEQVGVVYIESDELGFSATNIEIDEDGEFITRWPRGFFVERRKELM